MTRSIGARRRGEGGTLAVCDFGTVAEMEKHAVGRGCPTPRED